MIIRARPKYFKSINLDIIPENEVIKDNEFYFSSGRAALKFYLQFLSQVKEKKISIAMQAFNCSVVMDAALESECNIFLLDVKLEDLSVSCNCLEDLEQYEDLDVLLLTHYQGIPNLEYEKIIQFCHDNEIIVIEDLAQTIGSRINDIEVGSLSDLNIYSYAFDKPFTSLKGGAIKFNSAVDPRFRKSYSLLGVEDDKSAETDIKILKALYEISGQHVYRGYNDNVSLIRCLVKLKISHRLIVKTLDSKITIKIFRIIEKFGDILGSYRDPKIVIKRLNPDKVSLIKLQEKECVYDSESLNYIQKLSDDFSVVKFENDSAIINWNRYSVLDEEGNLRKYLLRQGYQVGNFNWPSELSSRYGEFKSVNKHGFLQNSRYASKYVLNIPVWSNRASKEKFRMFCKAESSLPIFCQAWWLDATVGDGWDVCVVEKGGEIVATMPYVIRKKYGMNVLTQPVLTQFLGPWLKPSRAKYSKMLSQEKELMSALIEQLPRYIYFSQNWNYQNTNWLPFFWRGFRQTTRYTYVLDDLTDLDKVWNGFEAKVKTDIRKAQKKNLKIKSDLPIHQFIELNRKTFARQNLSPPYSDEFVIQLADKCKEKNQCKWFIAQDQDGFNHAGVFLIWDENSAYYLMGGGDPDLRNSGATSFCMWEAIKFASTVTHRFDFEGSMLEPVERFFRAFGAKQTPYFHLNHTPARLPRLVRSFVDALRG